MRGVVCAEEAAVMYSIGSWMNWNPGRPDRVERLVVGAAGVAQRDARRAEVLHRLHPGLEHGLRGGVLLQVDAADPAGAVVEVEVGRELAVLGLQRHRRRRVVAHVGRHLVRPRLLLLGREAKCSATYAREPSRPCSSPAHSPTRTVRFGLRVDRLQDAHRLHHHRASRRRCRWRRCRGATSRGARRASPARPSPCPCPAARRRTL